MTNDAEQRPGFADARNDAQLLQSVHEHDLPPALDDLLDDYLDLDGARPRFMWKWVHRLAPQNVLPCVADAYVDDVAVDKTITVLFVTLLDDVLEKRHDRATFRAAATIPFEWQAADVDPAEVDAEYVAFTERVWETLLDRIRRGPEYETYAELFRYDVKQAIDAIEYSDLVTRRPRLATMADLERYESHNMAMFAYADIDLMHSPREHLADIGPLRDAVGTAQRMARIGNWVSTWRRELGEGDYSTGVLVYALEEGIIQPSDLHDLDPADDAQVAAIADRIDAHDVETRFLEQWHDHYEQLTRLDDELATMDLAPFVDGTEVVLRYHLASTGLK